MIVLLDTVTLIASADQHSRLGARAREVLTDPAHSRLLSAAVVWELGIKSAAGRLALPAPLIPWLVGQRELLVLTDLPITADDALAAAALPRLHADPFDRMLVAQALAQGAVLVTNDAAIRRYDVPTLW